MIDLGSANAKNSQETDPWKLLCCGQPMIGTGRSQIALCNTDVRSMTQYRCRIRDLDIGWRQRHFAGCQLQFARFNPNQRRKVVRCRYELSFLESKMPLSLV